MPTADTSAPTMVSGCASAFTMVCSTLASSSIRAMPRAKPISKAVVASSEAPIANVFAVSSKSCRAMIAVTMARITKAAPSSVKYHSYFAMPQTTTTSSTSVASNTASRCPVSGGYSDTSGGCASGTSCTRLAAGFARTFFA